MKIELKKITEPDGQKWFGVWKAGQIEKVFFITTDDQEEETRKKAEAYYSALCKHSKRKEETLISTVIEEA